MSDPKVINIGSIDPKEVVSVDRVINIGGINPKDLISIPKEDCPGYKTFDFTVTPDDLLDADGVAGLNDILDEQMTAAGINHMATDITYKFKTMVEGTTYDAMLRVTAVYVPDDLYSDDEG